MEPGGFPEFDKEDLEVQGGRGGWHFWSRAPKMRELCRERTPEILSIRLSTEKCMYMRIPRAHTRPKLVLIPTNMSKKPHNS